MRRKIISKLIGDNAVFSLQHRIFNVIALMGIIMSFSACLVNYALKLGTLTVIVPFGCGIMALGLYLMSIIGRKYTVPAMVTVIILSFVFFPAMWIINGGTYGSIPYYMLLNAGITVVLLAGLKRVLILAFYFVAVGALIAAEYRIPGLVTSYDSELIRYLDSSFGYVVCLVSTAALFAVLVDSYAKERQRAEEYLAVLERQNEEIEAKNRMLEASNAELKEAKEKAEDLNRLLHKEKEKLQKLSITDDLTGVYNRMYITARLREEVEASRKRQRKLVVALIDIDNFKRVNDTHGHLFGDCVLKRVGETIAAGLRQTDIVGRYGGEEFLLVLPDTGLENGYAVVERIRRKILDLKWENDLKVTISGGITELDGAQVTDLLTQADRLLYQAKDRGRNRIEKEPA
ncbi:MAG: diguanylate cyclase [Bacillota bacterium]|nr:diguanylate cyclase [Bacillota bacterium]